MKCITRSIACLLVSMGSAAAFDNPPIDAGAQYCYGHAMIGFDSVINSRVGVPTKVALAIVDNPKTALGYDSYSIYLPKVIMGAYAWKDSPHDYAVRVFYRCARQEGGLWSAQKD